MDWNSIYEYRQGSLYAKYSLNGKYPVGRLVGYLDKRGYIRTKFNGKMTFAHRVIWEMFNGKIEEGMEIDHINGIKTDNRIENLRCVDRFINCKNASIRKDNTSGATGVSYNVAKGKWMVQVQIDKVRSAVSFANKEDAIDFTNDVYCSEKKFTERHGK